MTAITIAALDNGALDLAHIANVATSTGTTATDRLGNSKKTVFGAVQSLTAFNLRGAFVTATAYALKDLYTSGGVAYAALIAHTSTNVAADLAAGKVGVHQGALVEDLASETDTTKGSAQLGDLGAGAGEIGRTQQSKNRDMVSVFGSMTKAQVTSVRARNLALTVGAAITTALSGAAALGAEVWAPAGTYNVNDSASAASWAGARLRGAGINNTAFKKSTPGDLLTLTSCSRGCVKDIAFDGTGMTSGGGLVLTGAGTGVMEVSGNQFANFPGRGIYANFTVGAGAASGLTFDNNLVLSCGNVSNVPQAEYRYCNDSKWSRNQYGANGLSGPRAPVGAYHFSCQAGDFGPSNYHWENLVGAMYENCDYTRFFSNRWETNQQEGVKMLNTSRSSFIGNHIHSNSMQATGTYDGMSMNNCGRWTIVGNKFYTFNAFQSLACLRLTTNCNSLTIVGNEFFDFAGAVPVVWDVSSFEIIFIGNLPVGYGLDQSLSFQSAGKAKAVPAGQTVFAGQGAQSFVFGDVNYIASRKCVARIMRVNLSAAPGVGQSITCTLQKGGVDTALVATVSGGAFTAEATGNIVYAVADSWAWKVVSSAGAATTTVTISTGFDA